MQERERRLIGAFVSKRTMIELSNRCDVRDEHLTVYVGPHALDRFRLTSRAELCHMKAEFDGDDDPATVAVATDPDSFADVLPEYMFGWSDAFFRERDVRIVVGPRRSDMTDAEKLASERPAADVLRFAWIDATQAEIDAACEARRARKERLAQIRRFRPTISPPPGVDPLEALLGFVGEYIL